jgi:four helix bundle protein
MAHNVSEREGNDPLRRMRVYQIAEELAADCWDDAEALTQHPIAKEIGGQLYAAVLSVASQIAEGYSRSSGKDRVRFFEYALGSVRESMNWYRGSRPVLGDESVIDRLDRLEEMRRLLLAIIPRERGRIISKSESSVPRH